MLPSILAKSQKREPVPRIPLTIFSAATDAPQLVVQPTISQRQETERSEEFGGTEESDDSNESGSLLQEEVEDSDDLVVLEDVEKSEIFPSFSGTVKSDFHCLRSSSISYLAIASTTLASIIVTIQLPQLSKL